MKITYDNLSDKMISSNLIEKEILEKNENSKNTKPNQISINKQDDQKEKVIFREDLK